MVNRTVSRYVGLFFDDIPMPNPHKQPYESTKSKLGSIDQLIVKASGQQSFKCEKSPHDDMDESYSIIVNPSENSNETSDAILSANTTWGIMRGLETFSQLVFSLDNVNHAIRPVRIFDEPRFKYRGFMLDTARHYISVDKIRNIIDAMAYNKLNVFHWHIIDDQAFPLQSSTYPQLTEQTAYRPNMIYTKNQVSLIIKFAAERGIRVIPELDSPGHTYALRSIPDLLTKCYNQSGIPNGQLGPIDPTNFGSYKAIALLIKEFASLFHDPLFHAGGDEVEFECWKSNPHINDWMAKRNLSGNFHELNNIYLRRVYDILMASNRSMLVWQEVFDNEANLPKDVIIQVWKYIGTPSVFMDEMKRIVEAGYRTILSSCWYLNYIDYGQDWVKFYHCNPSDSAYIKPELRDLVLGGEICMWSEFVDDTNVISRTWPRASAAAERLWSPETVTDVSNFLNRLEQIRCRMLFRGIAAEPVNGPSYC